MRCGRMVHVSRLGAAPVTPHHPPAALATPGAQLSRDARTMARAWSFCRRQAPLHSAARLPPSQAVPLVKLLLSAGAAIGTTDQFGQTPLVIALKQATHASGGGRASAERDARLSESCSAKTTGMQSDGCADIPRAKEASPGVDHSMEELCALLAESSTYAVNECDTGCEPVQNNRVSLPSAPPQRNQPCPCGSGDKFKLCCGGVGVADA